MEITAAARRLSPTEAETLWRAWKTERDTRARDHLVLSYAPMVRYLATSKVRELPTHCELDDLISCGLIALLEAVDRFDPAKGATFEQYAWIRVAGAIVDELRRQDWASRSARRTVRKVDQVRDAWQTTHRRVPTHEELAEAIGIGVPELRERLSEIDRSNVSSLNAQTRGGDGLMVEVGDTIVAPDGEHQPEPAVLRRERVARFRTRVQELTEREREVLRLVYVDELQGAEVGRRLGVSESRVSQILAGIRLQLRQAVDGDTPAAA